MQLMWVSGPTGSVRTISITARKVLVSVGVFAVALVAIGVFLQFVGLRVAIELQPSLARTIGGVTTEAEQQKVEAVYRGHLDQLRHTLNATIQEVRQLETLKNRFMDIATPMNLRERNSKKDDARGGPLVAPSVQHSTGGDLQQELSSAIEEFSKVESVAKSLNQDWADQLSWLHALPIGLPVSKDFRITSGFGLRNDPFTRHLAMHEGLDFVAEVGTPVLATAAGTVTRSGWDSSYGNVVEVRHIEGFLTRYAHLRQRLVETGQKVQRGDKIALLGSTGRSTGPHLHYEVMRNEHVLNPSHVLPRFAANVQ